MGFNGSENISFDPLVLFFWTKIKLFQQFDVVCKELNFLGDDQSVSIQMRGGPEPMMVTSWAQIMSLDPSYIGIYHCIATNSEGSVAAFAGVGVYSKELWIIFL